VGSGEGWVGGDHTRKTPETRFNPKKIEKDDSLNCRDAPSKSDINFLVGLLTVNGIEPRFQRLLI